MVVLLVTQLPPWLCRCNPQPPGWSVLLCKEKLSKILCNKYGESSCSQRVSQRAAHTVLRVKAGYLQFVHTKTNEWSYITGHIIWDKCESVGFVYAQQIRTNRDSMYTLIFCKIQEKKPGKKTLLLQSMTLRELHNRGGKLTPLPITLLQKYQAPDWKQSLHPKDHTYPQHAAAREMISLHVYGCLCLCAMISVIKTESSHYH